MSRSANFSILQGRIYKARVPLTAAGMAQVKFSVLVKHVCFIVMITLYYKLHVIVLS